MVLRTLRFAKFHNPHYSLGLYGPSLRKNSINSGLMRIPYRSAIPVILNPFVGVAGVGPRLVIDIANKMP